MDTPNGAIIRRAYDDFARGDIPAVFAAFDMSITWHIPSSSPLSGEYVDHDQVGGFFKRTMELSAVFLGQPFGYLRCSAISASLS